MITNAVRVAVAVVAAVLALAGCDRSHPPDTGTPTTGVAIASDPARDAYDQLVRIEAQRPELITESARRDHPWAFDPSTGKLADYREAYTNAAALDCPGSCVQAGYIEMLAGINAAIAGGG